MRNILAREIAKLVLVVVALPAACGLLVASCAHLQPAVDSLPKVLAYIQDAELALDIIETAEKTAFAVKPNPALQAKVEAGINDARTALDAGLKICTGATDLTQAQIDQAFANFKTAYTDILALLGPMGIHRGAPSGNASAGHGEVFVPDPILLSR